MVRLGRAFARGVGRGLAPPKFHGIRFRLGVWLAVALLPLLVLGGFQAQAAFRAQDAERRSDLQLAAERTAASAKARLDSTSVLLLALRPEALEIYCEPRLSDLVERLDGLDGLARLTATAAPACASGDLGAARPAWLTQAQASPWFERLRSGEGTVLARAPARAGLPPGLIVAIRLERPLGRFDGAMVAVIPLSSLQPDVDDRALPEGSQAALEMQQEGLLKGYEDFYVVAMYTSDSYMIHSKKPVASVADIAGQRIRVGGQIQTQVVALVEGAVNQGERGDALASVAYRRL